MVENPERDALIELVEDWRREPWTAGAAPEKDVEALADRILDRYVLIRGEDVRTATPFRNPRPETDADRADNCRGDALWALALEAKFRRDVAKQAAAEDEARLDAEAQALIPKDSLGTWHTITEQGKDYWREVARNAREVYRA